MRKILVVFTLFCCVASPATAYEFHAFKQGIQVSVKVERSGWSQVRVDIAYESEKVGYEVTKAALISPSGQRYLPAVVDEREGKPLPYNQNRRNYVKKSYANSYGAVYKVPDERGMWRIIIDVQGTRGDRIKIGQTFELAVSSLIAGDKGQPMRTRTSLGGIKPDKPMLDLGILPTLHTVKADSLPERSTK